MSLAENGGVGGGIYAGVQGGGGLDSTSIVVSGVIVTSNTAATSSTSGGFIAYNPSLCRDLACSGYGVLVPQSSVIETMNVRGEALFGVF